MLIEVLKPFRYQGRPHDAGRRYEIDDSAGHYYCRIGRAKPVMQTLADHAPEKLGKPAGASVVPSPQPQLPAAEKGAGGPQMTLDRIVEWLEGQGFSVAPPGGKVGFKPTPEAKPAPRTAYDRLVELFGNDYIEIFAPAGHGKSRLLAHVALEARRAGRKVLFLDCEHSLPGRVERELGDGYRRLDFMNLDGIIGQIAGLPKGLDLVCYDSVGFPVLIKFVSMSLRERGDAIAKTILLRGHLKHYAETNGALALGANQPVSELYGMTHELGDLEHRPPVGGKSIHIAKAVLRMGVERQTERESVFELRAFECQDLPFNKLLATFTVSDRGERMEWRV